MRNTTNSFIAVSKVVKKKLAANAGIPSRKIRILHNFVDLKKFYVNKNLEKEKLKSTCEYLHSYIPRKIDFGIILGSFLNKCIDFLSLKNKTILSLSNIPNMVLPTVPGHEKFIVYGKLKNKKILIFPGRLHLYEGYSMKEVVYPIKLLANLLADNIIITNSAGGLNPAFTKDDIMIIKDHINFMFDNPLFGNKYDIIQGEITFFNPVRSNPCWPWISRPASAATR